MTIFIEDLNIATLHHLANADEDIIETIQKMGRWNERRERPRPGGAARSLSESWRPIDFLNEDIKVSLESGSYSSGIRVIHRLSPEIYLAAGYILHFKMDPIPETLLSSLAGSELMRLVNLKDTSLENLYDARITSVMKAKQDITSRSYMAYLDVQKYAMDISDKYGTAKVQI